MEREPTPSVEMDSGRLVRLLDKTTLVTTVRFPAAFSLRDRSDHLEQSPPFAVVQALINWVEKDDAPVELIATKWQDNNATVGWDFTRRLCKYPLRSYYVGGDEKSWESFECR